MDVVEYFVLQFSMVAERRRISIREKHQVLQLSGDFSAQGNPGRSQNESKLSPTPSSLWYNEILNLCCLLQVPEYPLDLDYVCMLHNCHHY